MTILDGSRLTDLLRHWKSMPHFLSKNVMKNIFIEYPKCSTLPKSKEMAKKEIILKIYRQTYN